MRDKVLIDTSVWIDYLQGSAQPVLQQFVDDALAGKEDVVPKIVIAELIQGARTEKDIEFIKELLEAFTIVGEGEKSWFNAGILSFDLKKKGKTINLADCYISVIAKENRASLLTLGKHFKDIQKEIGLELIGP